MTRVWVFARRDLRRLAADRRALLVNLGLPLLLTAIMGLSFGGGLFGKKGISAIPVAIVAEDVPESMRDRLLEGLKKSGFFAPVWADSATADALVRSGDAAAALVLPPDPLTKFFEADSLVVEVWRDPGSEIKAGIVEEITRRGVLRVQAGEAAFRGLWPDDYQAIGADSLGLGDLLEGNLADIWTRLRDDDQAASRDRAVKFLTRQFDHQVALQRALLKVPATLAVADKIPAQEKKGREPSLFDYFLPSFAVFFLMFAVAGGARDLHRERARRTLQRQLLGPGPAWPIVLGKWVASVVQGVVMLSVLLLGGAILFRVNLGPDPWTLPLVILLTCTAAAGVFLLFALLVSNERRLDNLCTALILVSGMIGGNFLPVENLPPWAAGMGHYVFNYWANLAFSRVIGQNGSLAAVAGPLTVLAIGSAVLLVAIVWLFRARVRRGGWA
jgi:ABC-2 type transport system permease protein